MASRVRLRVEMAGLINEIDVDLADGRAQISSSEKFLQAARDLGTYESEDVFNGVLRKLATATPEKR